MSDELKFKLTVPPGFADVTNTSVVFCKVVKPPAVKVILLIDPVTAGLNVTDPVPLGLIVTLALAGLRLTVELAVKELTATAPPVPSKQTYTLPFENIETVPVEGSIKVVLAEPILPTKFPPPLVKLTGYEDAL